MFEVHITTISVGVVDACKPKAVDVEVHISTISAGVVDACKPKAVDLEVHISTISAGVEDACKPKAVDFFHACVCERTHTHTHTHLRVGGGRAVEVRRRLAHQVAVVRVEGEGGALTQHSHQRLHKPRAQQLTQHGEQPRGLHQLHLRGGGAMATFRYRTVTVLYSNLGSHGHAPERLRELHHCTVTVRLLLLHCYCTVQCCAPWFARPYTGAPPRTAPVRLGSSPLAAPSWLPHSPRTRSTPTPPLPPRPSLPPLPPPRRPSWADRLPRGEVAVGAERGRVRLQVKVHLGEALLTRVHQVVEEVREDGEERAAVLGAFLQFHAH
eukprot:763418-Prorocentrum_minimum.AAC.2